MFSEVSKLAIGVVTTESVRPVENGVFTSCPLITLVALLAIGLLATGGAGLYFKFVNVVTSGSLMGMGALFLFTAIVIMSVRARRSQEEAPVVIVTPQIPSSPTQTTNYPQQTSQYSQQPLQYLQQSPSTAAPSQLTSIQSPPPAASVPSQSSLLSREGRRKELSLLIFKGEATIPSKDVFNLAIQAFKAMDNDIYKFCAQRVLEDCCKTHNEHSSNRDLIFSTPEYTILAALFFYECAREREEKDYVKVISFDLWFHELIERPALLGALLNQLGSAGWHQFIIFFEQYVRKCQLPLYSIVTRFSGLLVEVCRSKEFADQATNVRTLYSIFIINPSQDDTEVRAQFLCYFVTTFCQYNLEKKDLYLLEAVFNGYARHADKEWMPKVLQVASLAFYQSCPKKEDVFEAMNIMYSKSFFGTFAKAVITTMSGGTNRNWCPNPQQIEVLKLIFQQEHYTWVDEDVKQTFDLLAILEPSVLETLLSKIVFEHGPDFLKYLLDRYKDPEKVILPIGNPMWNVTINCLVTDKKKGVFLQLQDEEFSLFFRCVATACAENKQTNWEPSKEQALMLQWIFSSSKFNLHDVNQQHAFNTLITMSHESLKPLFYHNTISILKHSMKLQRADWNKVLDVWMPLPASQKIIAGWRSLDVWLSSSEWKELFSGTVNQCIDGQTEEWKPSFTQQSLLETLISHSAFSFQQSCEILYKLFTMDLENLKQLLSALREREFEKLESAMLVQSCTQAGDKQKLYYKALIAISGIHVSKPERFLGKDRDSYSLFVRNVVQAFTQGEELKSWKPDLFQTSVFQLIKKHSEFNQIVNNHAIIDPSIRPHFNI